MFKNQILYFRLVKVAKKIGYQLLVLWGVVTVVFFLFNLTGSDPVQNLVGENANQEVVTNMRNKLRLNHSLGIRYLEYLNNLSPISVSRSDNLSEAFYADSSMYKGWSLPLSDKRSLWIKFPSLGKSFISEKSVSSIFDSKKLYSRLSIDHFYLSNTGIFSVPSNSMFSFN